MCHFSGTSIALCSHDCSMFKYKENKGKPYLGLRQVLRQDTLKHFLHISLRSSLHSNVLYNQDFVISAL